MIFRFKFSWTVVISFGLHIALKILSYNILLLLSLYFLSNFEFSILNEVYHRGGIAFSVDYLVHSEGSLLEWVLKLLKLVSTPRSQKGQFLKEINDFIQILLFNARQHSFIVLLIHYSEMTIFCALDSGSPRFILD